MENNLILRKGIVVEIVNKLEYLLEDVFNKEHITMTIPAKFRMNYFEIKIGDEIYVTVSTSDKSSGRMVLHSSFKVDSDLSIQKMKLDKKDG